MVYIICCVRTRIDWERKSEQPLIVTAVRSRAYNTGVKSTLAICTTVYLVSPRRKYDHERNYSLTLSFTVLDISRAKIARVKPYRMHRE